jgi:hypothetical protein
MSKTFEWRIYVGLVGICLLTFAVVGTIAVFNVPRASGYLDMPGPASAQSAAAAQTLSQVDTDLALSQALLRQAAADTEGSNT